MALIRSWRGDSVKMASPTYDKPPQVGVGKKAEGCTTWRYLSIVISSVFRTPCLCQYFSIDTQYRQYRQYRPDSEVSSVSIPQYRGNAVNTKLTTPGRVLPLRRSAICP